MPTLTATSAPYTGIPTVEPQAIPTRPQFIEANPAAFGALQGRSMSELGASLEQASGRLSNAVIARQELYNKVTAENATNNWMDETNKILYGDPNIPGDTGFYGKHGQAALDAYPTVRDALQKTREAYKASLTNDMQRIQFDNETRRTHTYLMSGVGRHYDTQFNAFQLNTAKAGQQLGEQAQAAAANAVDWNGFQLGLEQSLKAADREIDALGGSAEMRAAKHAEIRSEAVKKWTLGLAVKNPIAAQQFADANRDAFDKSSYEQITQHLKAERSKMQALIDTGQLPAPPGWEGGRISGGDLWSRVKSAEGGIGSKGEALVSPAGAVGISQILPSTAKATAAEIGMPYDERRLHTDQAYNEKLGKAYLDKMLTRYNGNEALAAAAYNAGPDRVDSWLRTIGDPSKGELTDAEFARKIPIKETRDYVSKIIGGGIRAPLERTAPTSQFDLAIGDSIAVQQIRHGVGGMEGTTATVGHSPQQVLNTINTAPEESIRGKTVFLSTGASNNPDQVAMAADQISALKKKGAANIIIPGVGPGVRNANQVNAQLKNIAAAEGATFFQPDVKWQKDGVHPAEVDKLRTQALAGKGPDRYIPPPEEGQLPDASIPGLTDRIKELQKKIPADDPERLMNAIKAERARANAAYADAQHSLRIKNELAKAQSDQAVAKYQSRMTSNSPNYPTTDEILSDSTLLPEAQRTLVGFIERQTKPDPASAVSARNTRQLFERVHLGEDDPNKIWSKQVFADEYNKGNITWADRERLEKDFDEFNGQTKQEIQKQRADLLRRAKVKIIPALALGKKYEDFIDAEGEERFAQYEHFVRSKINEYERANKNPSDLFDPANPAYLGKPEVLNGFKPPLNVILSKDMKSVKPTADSAKNLQELKSMALSGFITDEEAVQKALERGWIAPRAPEMRAPLQ